MTLGQGVADYFILGVVVVGGIVAVNRRRIEWEKARTAGALNLLGFGLGSVLVWPLLAGGALYEWTRPPRPAPVPEKPLAIEPAHLIEPVAVSDVEARAVPEDPLHAVPALPFGHLHARWQALLAQRQPGDALWTFAAPHEAWGITERCRGYVLVRDGVPGPYWITHWERQ